MTPTQTSNPSRLPVWSGGLLALALLTALPAASFAHRLGESYIMLSSHEDRIEGRVEAMLQDLVAAVPMDTDGDGKVSEEEFQAKAALVAAYVQDRVRLWPDGTETELEYAPPRVMDTDLGRFAVFGFTATRPVRDTLEVEYTVLFDALRDHRGLLILEYSHATGIQNESEAVSLVFTPRRSRQVVDPTKSSSGSEFVTFVKEGTHHIWIGIDHILFLIVLILPSVLLRRDGQWHAVSGFRPALLHVVKVVTIFTVAHSITLSLAALGIVQMQSRVVESIIAGSVVVAALNAAFLGRKIWPVIFAFGLFHGFGFASVLGHLTIDRRFLMPALLGFNVGVELGQIAIICATFPILWLLRDWRFYPRLVLQAGSGAIAALALVWLVERALDVTVLGIF